MLGIAVSILEINSVNWDLYWRVWNENKVHFRNMASSTFEGTKCSSWLIFGQITLSSIYSLLVIYGGLTRETKVSTKWLRFLINYEPEQLEDQKCMAKDKDGVLET